MLERLQPEAAFFGTKDGMRTGFIVFDLKDPSDMPTAAELFFQELGAMVDLEPVMTSNEVQAGLERYGSA